MFKSVVAMQGRSPSVFEGQARALAPVGPSRPGQVDQDLEQGIGHSQRGSASQFWQFPTRTEPQQPQQLSGGLGRTLQTRSLESGVAERGMQP